MKLKQLHEAATPGQWETFECSNGGKLLIRGSINDRRPHAPSTQMTPGADAELIAYMRNLCPSIIELYEATKYNYECRDDPRRDFRLEAALKALEQ